MTSLMPILPNASLSCSTSQLPSSATHSVAAGWHSKKELHQQMKDFPTPAALVTAALRTVATQRASWWAALVLNVHICPFEEQKVHRDIRQTKFQPKSEFPSFMNLVFGIRLSSIPVQDLIPMFFQYYPPPLLTPTAFSPSFH